LGGGVGLRFTFFRFFFGGVGAGHLQLSSSFGAGGASWAKAGPPFRTMAAAINSMIVFIVLSSLSKISPKWNP
jgi:hypothetical protein